MRKRYWDFTDAVLLLVHYVISTKMPCHNVSFSPGGFINAGLSDEPGYVDLKDENRPTKMPERYNQLYDNDWTDAFCELTNNQGLMEQHAIHILLEILMVKFRKNSYFNPYKPNGIPPYYALVHFGLRVVGWYCFHFCSIYNSTCIL